MSFRPRKRFGQHWLNSPEILNQIVMAAHLTPGDRLLEIGPGLGALTKRLLPQVQSLVAVELDRDLCQTLVKQLGQVKNFLLLQGDILSLDLDAPLENFPDFRPMNKVVANIPYNITAPILDKLLGSIGTPRSPAYESIVLLIQKEVAERLVATPETKAYNALSVKMQYLARCDWIVDVPPQAFTPPPQVNSAVVRLTPHRLEQTAHNPKFLGQLVKLGFANRRKMLRNNLKGLLSTENLLAVLDQLTLSPTVRAEEISLAQWIELSNQLEPRLIP